MPALPSPGACPAILTDIDETLTIHDDEWRTQKADPSYDPEMRPEANALMQDYADLGYDIIYITARGEERILPDGRTCREITEDWLEAHGFPWTDDHVVLSENMGESGDAAAEYKSGVIDELLALGWSLPWAYGNAESDITAFKTAIPVDHIFLVGVLAGTLDVVGIADEDAYLTHRAAQMPLVEACSR